MIFPMNWLEKHITLVSYNDPKDEIINAWTHFFGAGLSFAGLIYILINLSSYSTVQVKAGLIIFALSNILLYMASGCYHQLRPGNLKRIARILDHSNIYILISGTYTPILLFINNRASDMVAIILWSITALGIAFTLIFWQRLRVLHVALYVFMGWICILFWNDIIPYVPQGMIKFLILGGVTYTLGIIFYGIKKIPHGHAIWHLFVLAGSIFFYAGILLYLH